MRSVINVCTTAIMISCITAPIVHAGVLSKQSNAGLTVDFINNAKTYVDVSIDSKTNKYIVNALIQDKAQGLAVHVLVNKGLESDSTQKFLLHKLIKHNIPVRVSSSSSLRGYLVCGNSFVETGSFSKESVDLVYQNSSLSIIFGFNNVKKFDQVFSSIWSKSKSY